MNIENDAGSPLDSRIASYMRNIGDRDLGDRPGYLDVIIGSSLMITHNYDVENCVANGTTGTVIDIKLASDAPISWHKFPPIIRSSEFSRISEESGTPRAKRAPRTIFNIK